MSDHTDRAQHQAALAVNRADELRAHADHLDSEARRILREAGIKLPLSYKLGR